MELFDIPNYTGYKADKQGNIYSMIPKGCRNRFDRNKWNKEPTFLKPRVLPNGYLRVYLRNDDTNKREDVYVHRIIAELFLDKPEGKDVVNHKDCNTKNNCVDNLEWVTTKENVDYAFEYGYMSRDNKGRFIHK